MLGLKAAETSLAKEKQELLSKKEKEAKERDALLSEKQAILTRHEAIAKGVFVLKEELPPPEEPEKNVYAAEQILLLLQKPLEEAGRKMFFHHLQKPGVDLSIREPESGNGMLHYAVLYNGESPILSALLSKGIDINSLNSARQTALHVLCRDESTLENRNHFSFRALTVNLLLANGIDSSLKDDKGYTALQYAALNGHAVYVRQFLRHAQQAEALNIVDPKGYNVLDYALIHRFDRALIQELVEKGAALSPLGQQRWGTLNYQRDPYIRAIISPMLQLPVAPVIHEAPKETPKSQGLYGQQHIIALITGNYAAAAAIADNSNQISNSNAPEVPATATAVTSVNENTPETSVSTGAPIPPAPPPPPRPHTASNAQTRTTASSVPSGNAHTATSSSAASAEAIDDRNELFASIRGFNLNSLKKTGPASKQSTTPPRPNSSAQQKNSQEDMMQQLQALIARRVKEVREQVGDERDNLWEIEEGTFSQNIERASSPQPSTGSVSTSQAQPATNPLVNAAPPLSQQAPKSSPPVKQVSGKRPLPPTKQSVPFTQQHPSQSSRGHVSAATQGTGSQQNRGSLPPPPG